MNRGIRIARTIFPPKDIERIESLKYIYLKKIKVVVFVPPDIADRISSAMARGGAGKIGDYSECSFRANGEGTFRGGETTNPYTGTKGNLEKVAEQRIEMICSYDKLDNVLDEMLKVHPYEEPAYEVYDLWIRKKIRNADSVKITLRVPVELRRVLNKINRRLDALVVLDKLSKVKIQRAVINFSGKEDGRAFLTGDKGPVLYLAKNKNKSFTINLK
jgi:hypothetical protein